MSINIRDLIAHREAVMAQPRIYDDCPGLVYDPGHRNWYVPEGYSPSERTICESCAIKYDLGSKVKLKDIGVHPGFSCDSYYLVNTMGNDMYNISIWSADYRTFITPEAGTVRMPSGNFHMLIAYDIKKYPETRLFRARVYAGDCLIWTSPTAIKSVVGHKIGWFLNREHPIHGWSKSILTDCQLVVELDVFNSAVSDHRLASGKYLGQFVYENGATSHNEEIVIGFDHPNNNTKRLVAGHTYVPYSKKPITFNFSLTSIPVEEDTGYAAVGNKFVLACRKDARMGFRASRTPEDKARYMALMSELDAVELISYKDHLPESSAQEHPGA